MAKKILDKIMGSYFGGAIGDAMGGPVETMDYKKIKDTFGKVDDFLEYKSPPCHIAIDIGAIPTAKQPFPGTYTDDTQGRNLVAAAILKEGGRINADDFAILMLRDMDPEYWWPAVMVSYYRMKFYNVPVRDAGLYNPPGGGVAWYTPIGIINACDPRQAAWDTFDVCSFLKRGQDRELTAAVQAATAEAFKADATIDSVIEAACAFIHKETAAYIQKAVKLAKKCSDVYELYSEYYEKLLVEWDAAFQLKPSRQHPDATHSCDAREQVPVALALFYFCNGDAERTITAAVNFGRDSDTIASIAGSVAGAFSGIEAIPSKWTKILTKANPEPDLNKLCQDLHHILEKETNGKILQINHLKQQGLI